MAVAHKGRLQAWSVPAEQVHASGAPGRNIGVAPIVTRPDVLQSGPAPQDIAPAPAAAQVGIPVMQVGRVPVQKRLAGAAPENKKNQHRI